MPQPLLVLVPRPGTSMPKHVSSIRSLRRSRHWLFPLAFNFLGKFVDLTNSVYSLHWLTKTQTETKKKVREISRTIRWVTSKDAASISTRTFSASIMYKTFLQSKEHRFPWQTAHLRTVQEPKSWEFSVSSRVWFVFLWQAGSNLLSLAAALIKYFRDERWHGRINVHLSKRIAQHQLLPLAWRWFKADFICEKDQKPGLDLQV